MAYSAYKFRLYPNKTQIKELDSQLETLRNVYNATLAYWRDLYAEEKRAPTSSEIYSLLKGYRNLNIKDRKAGGKGPHYLANVAAVAMRDTSARVKLAFDHFFRRLKEKKDKAGFPRFKPYGRLKSIPFGNYNSGCVLRDRTNASVIENAPAARNGYKLDLFGVGRIKCRVHRDIVGLVKTACVQKDTDGKWYLVLTCKSDDAAPVPSTNPPVGIDVGLEYFLTTSDNIHVNNPRILKSKLKELRRKQRAVSRKILVAKHAKRKLRECRNYNKAQQRVARLHVKIRNTRKEHHHQVARFLTTRYGKVCVENLNVRGMLKNNKLSRAIADVGWSGFLLVLKHKAANAGVEYVEVDAKGTSQTCPQCNGEVRKKLSDRVHNCPHCGYVTQRDHAAAQVILARGVNLNPPGHGGVQPKHSVSSAAARSPNPARNPSPRKAVPRAVAKKPPKTSGKKTNRSRKST